LLPHNELKQRPAWEVAGAGSTGLPEIDIRRGLRQKLHMRRFRHRRMSGLQQVANTWACDGRASEQADTK
jgi:hypothetical protein